MQQLKVFLGECKDFIKTFDWSVKQWIMIIFAAFLGNVVGRVIVNVLGKIVKAFS